MENIRKKLLVLMLSLEMGIISKFMPRRTFIKNYDEFGVFEIGRTFEYKTKGENCNEYKVLGIAKTSIKKSEEELLFEAKSMVDSIARINKNIKLDYVENNKLDDNFIHHVNSYIIKYNDVELGYITSVNPRVKDNINPKANIVVVEIRIDLLGNIAKESIAYKEISRYQTVEFDFSIVVSSTVRYSDIENVIKN